MEAGWQLDLREAEFENLRLHKARDRHVYVFMNFAWLGVQRVPGAEQSVIKGMFWMATCASLTLVIGQLTGFILGFSKEALVTNTSGKYW